MSDEFSLLEQYFYPFSPKLGDDSAVLDIPPGMSMVTSIDTLVENTHFHRGAPPQQVGYRALVTALSDLAATGAQALACTLALTLPEGDADWLRRFTRGLREALEDYGVELIGGDTTRGPLTISVAVFGAVPAGRMLQRRGAEVGDRVYVSGPLGDAAAALSVLEGRWPGAAEHESYLLERFYRPTPRLQLGQQLLDFASSAIDVSDGLLADAAHIGRASGVRLDIDERRVPLSPALRELNDWPRVRDWVLGGGDDYELLFTVAAGAASRVPAECVWIGEVVAGTTPDHGPGYVHFSG